MGAVPKEYLPSGLAVHSLGCGYWSADVGFWDFGFGFKALHPPQAVRESGGLRAKYLKP